MNEPADLLIRAAVDRVQPMVRELRESGWAVTVVVHADPLSVALRISLDGLKRPVDVTGRTYEAARAPHTTDDDDPAVNLIEPQTLDEVLRKLDHFGRFDPTATASFARGMAEELRRVIALGAENS